VERARRNMTIALGSALALLGVIMVVSTVAHGGAGLTVGILVGVAFTVLGCARVYLAVGPRSQRRL
jgi:drug/metabolite transporter (DMT)-like permease